MKRLKDPELFSCIKKYLTIYLPQIKNRSSNTVEAHRFSLNLYLDFLIDTVVKDLSEIKATDFCQENILLFMEWLSKERKNEVTTVNVRLSNIRSFCKYLSKNGLILHSDIDDIAGIKKLSDLRKHEVTYLTAGTMKLILEQPDISKKTGIRDKFYMALLYDSGCRNQEVLDLQVKDFIVNTDGSAELHILGKGRKYRVTPISNEVTKLFYSYCSIFHHDKSTAQQHLLFYTKRNGIVTKMSPDNVQRFLSSYEASARKIQEDIMHLHPHLFRHTRAMHLYMAGVPLPIVSEWLGHSNMETTLIYAQASIEMKRKASEKLKAHESSVFKGDVTFKYDDDEMIKKLSGLK